MVRRDPPAHGRSTSLSVGSVARDRAIVRTVLGLTAQRKLTRYRHPRRDRRVYLGHRSLSAASLEFFSTIFANSVTLPIAPVATLA